MKALKEEYLGILCTFYLIILFAVLPLYMQDGYYLLGDGKYVLYRNCSLICMGIWLVAEVIVFFGNREKDTHPLAIVDIFMIAYAGCVLLSAFCSDFDTAWLGYADWHMGAVSQLLFVGSYFLISRYYPYDKISIYGAEAALLAVALISFAGRLGFDWLGVYQGIPETDWVRSNMLATIGNINWLCGYLSVVLAFPVSGFLYGKRRTKMTILYFISVLGLVLLVIQGSDSGPVLAAVVVGVCLLAGVKNVNFFQRGLLLLAGMTMGVYLMGCGITVFDAWNATPVESWIYHRMTWMGWIWLGILSLSLYGVSHVLKERGRKAFLQKMIKILVAVMLLVGGTLSLLILLTWAGGSLESFGSGRGILWKLAVEGFVQADWPVKLIGAGPDCFAEYLISIGKPPIITQEDHWANALFVNAHNEWLNHLVNMGILGVIAYAGIFVGALRRYRGMMLAVLVLAMYGVHSLVSFQQVLNTPLFFAVLGICEVAYRRKQELQT